MQIVDVDLICLEAVAPIITELGDLHPDLTQQVDEVVDVEDIGDVVDGHYLGGEEYRRDDL